MIEKYFRHVLFAGFTIILAASCSTVPKTIYLYPPQIGLDSVVPPPENFSSKRADANMIFGSGSLALGSPKSLDYDFLGQGGVVHSWRRSTENFVFDGHIALSGWYGDLKLHDSGDTSSFYGASAQAGISLGFTVVPGLILDLGPRIETSYEGGAFRNYRSEAAANSSIVENEAPSNWTGNWGLDLAFIWSINDDFDIRTGIFDGTAFEIKKYSELSVVNSPLGLLFMPSLALRYRHFFIAASMNWYDTTSLAIGYIF